MGIAKAAVGYAMAVIIGFSAFTATFSSSGVSLGPKAAMAGEVQQQMEGDFETRDQLLEYVKGLQYLGERPATNVKGQKAVMKGYKSGSKMVIIYEIFGTPYGYAYMNGKYKLMKFDKGNDKIFEQVHVGGGDYKFDIDITKYRK